MKVLKATIEQYNNLNGFMFGNSKIEFATDNNNNFIIGIEVLSDPNFESIKTQLLELEIIDFEPSEK